MDEEHVVVVVDGGTGRGTGGTMGTRETEWRSETGDDERETRR